MDTVPSAPVAPRGAPKLYDAALNLRMERRLLEALKLEAERMRRETGALVTPSDVARSVLREAFGLAPPAEGDEDDPG